MLLFAIVLGLTAVASAVSGSRRQQAAEQRSPRAVEPPASPAAPPSEGRGLAYIRFRPDHAVRVRRLQVGRPALVIVEVNRPGQVEISGLGLAAPAEPLTPARFDVLPSAPGRFELRFTPAGELATGRVGTLSVVPAGTP
jgi:hypothetical protein